MRTHLKLPGIVLSACFLPVILVCQGEPAKATPQSSTQQAMSFRTFSVKNVPPALMAWEIDPEHNKGPFIPTEVRGETRAGTRPVTGKANTARILPRDVLSVIALPAQRALLVYGTDRGAAQVEKLVSILDQPLRYASIEARVVEIDQKSAEPPNESLDSLIARHEAFQCADFHLLALNNFHAHADGGCTYMPIDLSDPQVAYRGTRDALTIVPTINDDNTVTISLVLEHRLLHYPYPGAKPTQNASRLSTVVNVRSGDSLPIGGILLNDPSEPNERSSRKDLVVLLTAEIVDAHQEK